MPDQRRAGSDRGDWKQRHANEAHRAVEHPLVQEVMAEFADNMGFALTGLPAYGLAKVAHYAAQVARAQALHFDPELLRLTPEEANRVQWELAARAVYEGVPTTVIEGLDDV